MKECTVKILKSIVLSIINVKQTQVIIQENVSKNYFRM